MAGVPSAIPDDNVPLGITVMESKIIAVNKSSTPLLHFHCLEICNKTDLIPFENAIKGPRLNLQLLQLLLYEKEAQETFCSDLSMRSGISITKARFLSQRLFDSRFCSFNHNQTRHCKDAVDIGSSNERGLKRGFSVFRGKGCLQTSCILRPISRPHRNTLEEMESYSELVDSVRSYSGDALSAKDVFRRQACGTCRYVLRKGSTGTKPMVDNAVLTCATDLCLVDCVLLVLEMETTGEKESVYIRGNQDVMTEARNFNEVVAAPFAETPNARFLPVSEKRKLRTVLHEKSIEGSVMCVERLYSRELAPFWLRGMYIGTHYQGNFGAMRYKILFPIVWIASCFFQPGMKCYCPPERDAV